MQYSYFFFNFFFLPLEDINMVIMENISDINSSYFDYDADLSFTYFFYEELIPVAIVYGITLVVGLIGNLLIIYTVMSFRRMRTISNVFLASLATADLLVVLICVPVKVSIVYF